MTERQRYSETTVRTSGDPMVLSARLARSALHDHYMVYERAGEWWYAAGTEVELMLLRDRIDFRQGTERTSLPWTGDPMPAVHELLSGLTLDSWRAYGWASFELSYALGDRSNPTAPDTDGTLMYLVVPALEIRIADGEALIRCTDPAMAERAGELLRAPAETNPHPALVLPVDVTRSGKDTCRKAVSAAVSAIRGGELHKIILSRVVEVADEIDFVDTFLTGRRANNPARSFLLRLGGLEAAGFSPETVVEVAADGSVSTQPLAGTRALTGDGARDAELRTDLPRRAGLVGHCGADPAESYHGAAHRPVTGRC